MPSKSGGKGKAAAADRQRSKRRDQAADQQRAAIEAKLASADQLIEKRRSQLREASAQRTTLAAELARLLVPAGDASQSAMAYCIRDRQQVAIAGAHPVVLTNGRPAIAGLCPTCGSKVMRLGAR